MATCVWITRPEAQQEPFASAVESLGYDTLRLPCLGIEPIDPQLTGVLLDAALGAAVGGCTDSDTDTDSDTEATADLALFTSRNAVLHACAARPLPWPDIRVMAIGQATADALAALGQPVHIEPVAPFNSEACLYALDEQPGPLPRRVLLVKGMGGRTTLEDGFHARSVLVDIACVYRRVQPQWSAEDRRRLLEVSPPDIISITSDAVLKELVVLADGQLSQLRPLPMIVNSERARVLATDLGFTGLVEVASPAGDIGQLALLDSAPFRRASRQS